MGMSNSLLKYRKVTSGNDHVKLKVNVSLPQLLCIVVFFFFLAAAQNS